MTVMTLVLVVANDVETPPTKNLTSCGRPPRMWTCPSWVTTPAILAITFPTPRTGTFSSSSDVVMDTEDVTDFSNNLRSAITVTSSPATTDSSSSKFSSVVTPESTRTSCTVSFLCEMIDAETSYVPTGTFKMINEPSAFAAAPRTVPSRRTLAPARGSPVLMSVTTPTTLPVACANTHIGKIIRIANTATTSFFINNLL